MLSGKQCESEDMENPIGKLQELCMKHQLAHPIYKEEFRFGATWSFAISCKVAQFCEVGEGSTKRAAKTNAASKVLKTVSASLLRNSSSDEEVCVK